MRVLLVGNYERDAQQSMARYAAWLVRVLRSRGHEVTVARPQAFFSRLAEHPGLRKYLGYLDKFLLFPPRLRGLSRDYDLVHILDHSNSMYLRSVRARPNLITCHDVLAIRAARGEFPATRTGWTGRLLQRWILAGLRRAGHVVCVSAKTADDLKTLIGTTGAEMSVIANSLNWKYRPGVAFPIELATRLSLDPGDPYLLHVGGNQWYKNRAGVVRIFARQAATGEFATAKLIMAGKPFTDELHAAVREERLEERVIELTDASNEELQALYSNAVALLFPSLEEGFGWPILEAQACGCPVITTNRPPMSEVAGEGAILIDPLNLDEATAAIIAGLRDPKALRAAGFRNATRFDEATIADQYCAFYGEILGNAPADSSK
jgi:glycosyltransferase involved in cell wall biosynthesis